MVEQVKNGRRCYGDREEELKRDFRAIDKDVKYLSNQLLLKTTFIEYLSRLG